MERKQRSRCETDREGKAVEEIVFVFEWVNKHSLPLTQATESAPCRLHKGSSSLNGGACGLGGGRTLKKVAVRKFFVVSALWFVVGGFRDL